MIVAYDSACRFAFALREARMLPPSRERAVCFEEKVACVVRFERAYSYPDVRRLFSGSWSGTGADCHLN